MKRIPARYLLRDEHGKPVWVTNIYAYTEEDLHGEGINTVDMVEDIGDEFEWINVMLSEAHSHGLSVEVVQFALREMKNNPQLTPAQAIRIGYSEWVK